MGTIHPDKLSVYRQSLIQRQAERERQFDPLRLATLERVKNVVNKICVPIKSIEQIYVFGSLTRPGAFLLESDIDLAVVGATAEDYWQLWEAFSKALPEFTIDLRRLPEEKTPFSAHIRRTGSLIYARPTT